MIFRIIGSLKNVPTLKYFIAVIGLALFAPYSLSAQCTETDEEKVLLVGDSWAFFMGADGTINTVFDQWGHSNYEYLTNTILAENGAETDDFMEADKQDEIAAQLNANPGIDVVHLSLGGNDVLGSWNVDFLPYQTDSLIDTVLSRLLTITDFIKATEPGIRIVWSGYVYPNFGQVLEDAGFLQTIHPFYGTWEGMGFPDFLQLNTILNDVSAIVDSIAAADPQIDFVNATGIIQHTYGQPEALSVPPGGAYAPFQAPLPEGYPDYPSPKPSMRSYGLFLDCFHLSQQAYRDFISYQTQKFYHKYFMKDQYFLAQSGTVEGSVRPDGSIESGVLKMGTFNGETYRSVITFDMADLPPAGVTSADLFVRRETLLGNNPLNSGLQLKVMNGFFGTTVDLEPEDFNAVANATTDPCVFGSSSADGHWIRIELPPFVLGLIDNTSTVQFMLSTPEATDGIITFTNSNDPDFAPVLSVNHDFVTGVQETAASESNVVVYPNPTTGTVFMTSNSGPIRGVEVLNAQGRLVRQVNRTVNTIGLDGLSQGLYLLRIHTEGGTATKRILKR